MPSMGIWPFGRDPADVEMASRIVTATVGDKVKVRGKLSLHFAEPQTQAIADDAAERCAALMEIVLREQRDHESVVGAEGEMVLKLVDRMPPTMVPTRMIELAALHVVGDPALTARKKPSTASFQAVRPPSAPPPAMRHVTPWAPPTMGSPPTIAPKSSVPKSSGTVPPPSAVAPSSSVPKRRSSTRMRALTASLVLPVGSSPQSIGAAIAPLLRDTSFRLLIGFLRIHDLIAVRGVLLEEGSPELQVAVSTILDQAPGEEATRTAEIGRWESTLGVSVVDALRREALTVATFLAHSTLGQAGIPQDTTVELLDECCTRAAPGEPSPLLAIEPYTRSAQDALPSLIDARITKILGGAGEPGSMNAALTPLVASVEEDISIASTLAKHALGP